MATQPIRPALRSNSEALSRATTGMSVSNYPTIYGGFMEKGIPESEIKPREKAAGIEWHGWYALRRGVATAISALSKGSIAAKGLLRHSNVSTTERHYIKDVPESTLLAMAQLEALCKDRARPEGIKPS